MSRSHWLWFAALGLAATSCDTKPQPDDLAGSVRGPNVVLVDSMQLGERADAFIAMPIALSVLDRSGRIVVGDAVSGQVFRFEQNGALQAVLGGHGSGPGEFTAPGPAVELADGGIVIADWATDHLLILEPDGVERSRIGIAGLAFSLASDGRTVFAGRLARQAPWTAAIRVDPMTGEWLPMVTAPSAYGVAPQLRVAHPYVSVALISDGLLVGFTGANQLLYAPFSGPEREIHLPAIRRRLLPDDLARAFAAPLPDSVIAGMASVLTGLHPIGDGQVFAVHLDTKLRGRRLEASGWISWLDLITGRACVDAVLPVRGLGKPLTAVLGDTLLVLEQVADSGSATPRAMIYKYRVDRDGCEWQEVT